MTKRYAYNGPVDFICEIIARQLDLSEGAQVDGKVVRNGERDTDGDLNDTGIDLLEWETDSGWANLPLECFEEVEA